MAQAPTNQDDLPSAFDEAQKAVRHSRNAARDAAKAMARLRDDLEAHGIEIGVVDANDHGPSRAKGDA